MRNRYWIIAMAMAAIAPNAGAQAGLDDDTGKIYRLDENASYHETCFAPCDCPPSEPVSARGTLVLGPAMPGNVVDFHRVNEVHWTVGGIGETVHTITGRGSYRITNYGLPREHALDLTVSVDDGEPVHFFSDFVPADPAGGSLDIPVSINGMFCHDTVIRVSAAIPPPGEVVRYALGPDSSYQQGCFDPCDCALEEPRPMRGGFLLTPLYDTGTYAEFALNRARFAAPPAGDARGPRFSGFGRYTLIQGFAGPADTMDLVLRSGLLTTRYDSPLTNTDAQFPRIAVTVDMNDQVCFDKLLTIDAAPAAAQDTALR